MANCFDRMLNAIKDVGHAAETAFKTSLGSLEELKAFFVKFPGSFITFPAASNKVPVLWEIFQRLQTPLDRGFGVWHWYNQEQPNKTVLQLPQAPRLYRVSINGSTVYEPKDYTLAGTTLTLVRGLDIGDMIMVRGFGG